MIVWPSTIESNFFCYETWYFQKNPLSITITKHHELNSTISLNSVNILGSFVSQSIPGNKILDYLIET